LYVNECTAFTYRSALSNFDPDRTPLTGEEDTRSEDAQAQEDSEEEDLFGISRVKIPRRAPFPNEPDEGLVWRKRDGDLKLFNRSKRETEEGELIYYIRPHKGTEQNADQITLSDWRTSHERTLVRLRSLGF